jgi:predicted unusual protein kinase regulating ubiquinone biosynthesis (AarF/ABC1/UbiB family)
VTSEEDRFYSDANLLGRAARIGRVTARHGLREFFFERGNTDDESMQVRAHRFKEALEELGPTFAKLGQVLSTRPDLLPQPFIDELAKLQDDVEPLTEAQVVSVMEEELGVPWEDVFASVEEMPLAAGTMAQVHRATLENGARVVFKVQRPTAAHDIIADVELLKIFAEKTAERSAFRQVIDAPAIIEHLTSSLKRELDFRNEAANLERMREVLEPFDHLDVPRLYQDFTTARFLVMEEIEGVSIRETEPSPARKEAAKQLLEAYYRQILTEGFFHADPHPGNLMWWNDKIYFLDFGMVGEIVPEVRELLMLMLMALWQEDTSFLADVILQLAGANASADLDAAAFESDLDQVLKTFKGKSLKDIQLGPMLQEITEISIKHNVRLPASMALTGKALAQMQLAAAEMDPELDPFGVAGHYVMRSLTDQFRHRVNPRNLYYEAQKVSMRVRRLVEALERLTGARAGPRMQIQFTGTERLEASIQQAGRRLAMAIVAGAAFFGAATTSGDPTVADWVPISSGALGGGLTLALIVDFLRRRK